MGKNKELVRILCQPHCTFYKPGKSYELLCQGAVIVERLMHAGRTINSAGTKGLPASKAAIELLVQNLCAACEFQKNDCDFAKDHKAQPCGGFVLLSRLLETDQITSNDIK